MLIYRLKLLLNWFSSNQSPKSAYHRVLSNYHTTPIIQTGMKVQCIKHLIEIKLMEGIREYLNSEGEEEI